MILATLRQRRLSARATKISAGKDEGRGGNKCIQNDFRVPLMEIIPSLFSESREKRLISTRVHKLSVDRI
jgi:hypothetical protein